jgi:tetratricopeptide (TPR) repeat protein
MVIAYGNLGSVYQNRGDLDQAEEMYEKALAISKEMGHKQAMAGQYCNLAALYEKRDDWARIEDYFEKALELYKEIGAEQKIAQIEEILASIRDILK